MLLKLADALEARADELGRLESANAGKPVGAAIDEIASASTCSASSPARPGDGRPRGERVPGRPHLDHPARPDRRRRLDRAVELPAVHGGLEARAGARHRQHRRPEAVDPDAAQRLGFGEILAEILPAGRRERHLRDPARRSATPSSATRRSGWSRSPATPRPASASRRSRPIRSSGSTWSSAARRRSSSSTTPTSTSRPRRSARGLLERRPGLHRGDARPRRPRVYDSFVGKLADQVRDDQVGRPGRGRRPRDGLAHRAGPGRQGPGHGRPRRDGAEVVVGGERPDRAGAYYEPTVIAGPDQKSEIIQDEIFGPVVTVQRFSDEEQAIAWANDTPFGLARHRVHHRHRAGDARGEGAPVRPRLDQRALHAHVGDAARRRQAVRLGQGRLEVRARGLHVHQARDDQIG